MRDWSLRARAIGCDVATCPPIPEDASWFALRSRELLVDGSGMGTQPRNLHRISCANDANGREFFELRSSGGTVRISTPGALTRTWWSRQQASQLRDALSELLGDTGSTRDFSETEKGSN